MAAIIPKNQMDDGFVILDRDSIVSGHQIAASKERGQNINHLAQAILSGTVGIAFCALNPSFSPIVVVHGIATGVATGIVSEHLRRNIIGE